LALRTLRRAGLLAAYPADPLVLDDWELEHIFDAEFLHASGVISKPRREQIRRLHEAIWSTGTADHPGYRAPDPPISEAERAAFEVYHRTRGQIYSCALPGELVRRCVDRVDAGLLNPVDLLGISHVIVDEFQDLNPYDLRFVDHLVACGAIVFVAGDDDQSIYAFRFADPDGIQDFTVKHADATSHSLAHCFRCTPNVLAAAYGLLAAHPAPKRLPKRVHSLYGTSVPPVPGQVHLWRFRSGIAEARAIAGSCQSLIAAGISPDTIMILLSSVAPFSALLAEQLEAFAVPFEAPREEPFSHTPLGRLLLAMTRIVTNRDDYVAHRTLLGGLTRVGTKTTHDIAECVLMNNLNYKALFYDPLPQGRFAARSVRALELARAAIAALAGWQPEDTLTQRQADFGTLLGSILGPAAIEEWNALAGSLPQRMTVSELRTYLWADSARQQSLVLQHVYERLNDASAYVAIQPPRVRMMTMHGAKGLSAHVVFIPGLEEPLLPGPRRAPFPSLVLEAARLLFVSMTRARAACFLSFATSRLLQGQPVFPTPSRFCQSLGGPFVARNGPLTGGEVAAIAVSAAAL